MKNLRAAYQEMYLVTKNVYAKVLDCIDERSRANVEELNRQEQEEVERRPAEEYFDDIADQDIAYGVGEQSVPIQEREEEYVEPSVSPPPPPPPPLPQQRPYLPRLTYEPSLPPIADVLRNPEQLRPIPRLTKSNYPRLMYQPSQREMELQSEIIGPERVALGPVRPERKTFSQRMPPIRGEVMPSQQETQGPIPHERFRESVRSQQNLQPPPVMERRGRHSPSGPPLPSRKDFPGYRQKIPLSHQPEGLERIVDYQRPSVPAATYQDDAGSTQCVPGRTGRSICSKPYQRPTKPNPTEQTRPKQYTPTGHVCEICGRSLASRYNLNRHLSSVHRKQAQKEPAPTVQDPDQPQPGFSGWTQDMETGSLPVNRKRSADPDEEEDPEDIPLSKVFISRKKRQEPPTGSGKKEAFENWQ